MTGPTRRIGRYDNAEKIGQGGFATVYRAADAEHGREVAIKVIHGALGETEKRRFDRERQTMGRLGAHPNIIPLHDSGYTEDGEAFIVMELAAGGSLQQRLTSTGPLDWTEAVSIMVGIARAADAAHSHGVLHRDIKPDNILIDAFDNPKLSDFGIAAVTSNATATTSTSATLAHAAPELLDGQQPSPAVDIYAIGSTLHNLMTGQAPFVRVGDETVTGLITRTLSSPPPDLRPLGVPDHVARIVERAMAKEPAQRQASAAELADALEDSLTGKRVATETTPLPPAISANDTQVAPRYQPSSPVHQPSSGEATKGSNRTLMAVVGAVLALAVGIGAMIALTARSTGETSETSETSEMIADDGSEATSPTTAPPSTSTTTSTTTTSATTTSATTTSTTTIVEVDLTASSSAVASSEAPDGVDACGEETGFGADNVLDTNPTTAWRTPGAGVGEVLDISLNSTKAVTRVGLIPGYAKVDPCDGVDRFTQNRRITTVRWTVGDTVIEQNFNADQAVMQFVTMPEPVITDFVLVEIVSTTEDGGRDFTAISDIAITGG